MNGKIHSEEDILVPADLLNPFVHRLELSTTYDKIKTGILTVAVLPFRVFAIMVLLVMAWMLACIGLMGLSEQELRTRPLSGWRRGTRAWICRVMRALFLFGGFHWVSVKGRQATAKEAPVLAVAPHSSYFDALPVVYLGAPSVVAKGETGYLPFFGKLINYTQPVYVWREDPNSRQNTIKEIIDRATSDLDWPQVLIFPEGTCTNRSCLITFKSGAFYPGVPIQPVCIRYPNKLDTVTWTWEGPGALKLLWLTLTQVHSACEIEFLPVYHPNEAEKNDPKLYANNVRQLMAKALGVPVSDFTYDDCRIMTRAKQMNLPYASELVEVQKLRNKLGLAQINVEEKLVMESSNVLSSSVSYKEFAQYLGMNPNEPNLQQLFKLYDKENTGVIDFREYLLGVLVISKASSMEEFLELAFKIYDRSGLDHMSLPDFIQALQHTLHIPADEIRHVFQMIDLQNRGFITYSEFKNYIQQKPEYASIFSTNNSKKTSNKRKENINSVVRDCKTKSE